MELPVNHFKHALKAGKPQIGIWSSLCSHIVADVLANSGFDWVLLDTEHSPNELSMVQHQLHAMQGGTANPVVRVSWNDMVMIKRFSISARNRCCFRTCRTSTKRSRR